jgi:hypothetical protein
MKRLFTLLTFLFHCSIGYPQTFSVEETRLWDYRTERFQTEMLVYNWITKNQDKQFPMHCGLLSNNDTLRFANGNIFRTCEIKNRELNGLYTIYYPNGALFLTRKYSSSIPVDTAYTYNTNRELFLELSTSTKTT